MAKRRKRSALDRALHHMKPNRVAARFFSGGKHQTFTSIAKSPFKPKTIATPKSGRKQYQAAMRRERQAQVKATAAQRKQQLADQRALRAQIRKQQPRRARSRQQPVAVNPHTGRPITWREADKGVRDANRQAQRIEDELAGRVKPTPKPRKPRAPKPEPTPLQRAVAETQANKPKKKAAARPAAKKPTTKPSSKPRPTKKLAPPPDPAKAPGKTISGIVMAATCACQGTGRIAVMKDGLVAGSVSCPTHGRTGTARGQRKRTPRGAIRDSGLPGLAAWLGKRQGKKRGNSDRRQAKAFMRARRQVRHAGPTLECEWCEGGIVNRLLTERLRKQHIDKQKIAAARAIAAAEAHNAKVEATGEGKKVRVPKMPSQKVLEAVARRAYPHDLCSRCKGLGRVETKVTLAQDGQQPVGEWRATAGLKEGHRLTGREQATGKRMSKNAARVERNRKLPRP